MEEYHKILEGSLKMRANPALQM